MSTWAKGNRTGREKEARRAKPLYKAAGRRVAQLSLDLPALRICKVLMGVPYRLALNPSMTRIRHGIGVRDTPTKFLNAASNKPALFHLVVLPCAQLSTAMHSMLLRACTGDTMSSAT